jgi:hypothetical protein
MRNTTSSFSRPIVIGFSTKNAPCLTLVGSQGADRPCHRGGRPSGDPHGRLARSTRSSRRGSLGRRKKLRPGCTGGTVRALIVRAVVKLAAAEQPRASDRLVNCRYPAGFLGNQGCKKLQSVTLRSVAGNCEQSQAALRGSQSTYALRPTRDVEVRSLRLGLPPHRAVFSQVLSCACFGTAAFDRPLLVRCDRQLGHASIHQPPSVLGHLPVLHRLPHPIS